MQTATHSSENNKWDWFLLIFNARTADDDASRVDDDDGASRERRAEIPISRLLLAKAK